MAPGTAALGKMRRGGAGSWAERSPESQQVMLSSPAHGSHGRRRARLGMSNKTMMASTAGGPSTSAAECTKGAGS